MSGRVKLNIISESTETLKTLLGQQKTASGKEEYKHCIYWKLSKWKRYNT